MIGSRRLFVHFTPQLVAEQTFDNEVAIVIDVLRATTTIVYALASGCNAIIPVATVEEARRLVVQCNGDAPLLMGERDGRPPDGFDFGNSPCELTSERCNDRTLIATTTNGTNAILHARKARRILLGAFVNLSAVCAEIKDETGPVHVLCSGSSGDVALEDVLCAGAIVECLMQRGRFDLSDSARIAWDVYDRYSQMLTSALELCEHGRRLRAMGLAEDVFAAAEIDRFAIIPEATGDPTTISVARVRLECGW